MIEKFEDAKPSTRHTDSAAREHDKLKSAAWQTKDGRIPTEDTVKADIPLHEMYKNKDLFSQYKKVGFHTEGGETFLRTMEKFERDETLTDDERDTMERVRGEVVSRMGAMNSCSDLLTKEAFKGLRDAHSGINNLVGRLGEDWALEIIKPRLLTMIGEEHGSESLTELWTSLRDMHNVYKTKSFSKVMGRVEKYRERFNITPAKWAEIQRGGDMMEISERAYGELQKSHGFFGKAWHAIPNYVRAKKIGFAGWRQEYNSSMVRLGETRSRAVDVLGTLLNEDFQKIIDRAVKVGKPETEKLIKAQNEVDRKHAEGMSEPEIKARHDQKWREFKDSNLDPTNDVNTAEHYDNWRDNVFKPEYQREVNTKPGGWLARLMGSLFTIRVERIPRPAGV